MILKLILVSVVLLGIGFIGFAITILVKKNGQFPETHIGKTDFLKKEGVTCATSQDMLEQAKAFKKGQYSKETILEKELSKL
ncbi:hypothetical protein DWB61_14570 [Ancylomarina euxinus]|uniref:Uncharacterized protein n=1 Tax=Ancylomarina euxinus TaxID=2283627 RepID=A0A425XXX5_9BACT|nr:hypothetical protein [Ancylomarina euxinus]MCZ4695868.1 hypothetical protein [Ancylomarina euxinus]MUP16243.1 hypothetical protein [Ancylomarina euxinus]RRG19613.1 hypothetical protein DWB61_14570 [Ancylomarina euxinus]